MKALVSYLTRKAKGGVARRDDVVETDVLRFGRGADCEVHFVDPRVQLHHAQIVARPGGYFLEGFGVGDFEVGGQRTQAHRLNAGEKIQIGPYEVEIVGSPEGYDIALTVELVRPLGDDLEMLKTRSRVHLAGGGLGKRGWSWLLLLVTAAFFLGAPLYAFVSHAPYSKNDPATVPHGALATADSLWLSGPMSGPHKFFGVACNACHEKPFVQVRDESCVACHTGIEHHADTTKFSFAGFQDQACQSCHKEHNGDAGIILRADAFCADCHSSLKQQAAAAGLENASDFGRDHPQFRATAPSDAAGKFDRVSLGGRLKLADQVGKPVEVSNLKFPHSVHLVERGVRHPEKGLIKLDCGGCHVPDSGKVGMLPVKMEANCIECHQLRFDPGALDRELPHGKPIQALAVLGDFYAQRALQGGVEEAGTPDVVRRRPGTPIETEAERQEALAWAKTKTDQVAERVFGKSLCGSCHTVTKQDGQWEVAKIRLMDRFLPKGVFDHGRHLTVGCADCHNAKASEVATDLLLPGIENCQSCHGGEKAADKVPSTCVSCHDFHRPGLPPMRGPAKAAALGR